MYLKKSYVKIQSCPRLVIHYDWLKITVCEDRVLRMCPIMEAVMKSVFCWSSIATLEQLKNNAVCDRRMFVPVLRMYRQFNNVVLRCTSFKFYLNSIQFLNLKKFEALFMLLEVIKNGSRCICASALSYGSITQSKGAATMSQPQQGGSNLSPFSYTQYKKG